METRKIICTSPSFKGEIYLEFDRQTELLVKLDFTGAELKPSQLQFFHDNPLRSITAINKLVTDEYKLEFTDKEISFKMFYDRYAYKGMVSPKKLQKMWDKMPEIERIKAYKYIPTYFSLLPQGTNKKYPDTYLNSEIWNS